MAEARTKPDYETGEVGRPWVIALSVCATILVAAICMTGLYFLYLPFAMEKPIVVTQFPAPRLQAAPAGDLAALEKKQMAKLHRSGWNGQEPGRAFIPIEAAMKVIAARGEEGFAPLPGAAGAAQAADGRRPADAHPPAGRPSNPGGGPTYPSEAPQ